MKIYNFKQFNEAMGTLSDDDNDTIEDLSLDFFRKMEIEF
jgi:hypothetical protein